MGWMRVFTDVDPDDKEYLARRAEVIGSRLKAGKKQLEGLDEEVAEVTIFQQAIMRLLIEKGILTPQEIADKVREIDLEDGVEDGRITKPGPSGPTL